MSLSLHFLFLWLHSEISQFTRRNTSSHLTHSCSLHYVIFTLSPSVLEKSLNYSTTICSSFVLVSMEHVSINDLPLTGIVFVCSVT